MRDIKESTDIAPAQELSWLELCPSKPRLWFDPWSGHIQEAAYECINKWNNKLISAPSQIK